MEKTTRLYEAPATEIITVAIECKIMSTETRSMSLSNYYEEEI